MYRRASSVAIPYNILVLYSIIAEAPERVEGVSIESLHSMIKDQGKVGLPLDTYNKQLIQSAKASEYATWRKIIVT